MAIHAAVIHKLIKEQHGPASVQTRGAELPLTEPVQHLVGRISDLYNEKASKAYGRFEDDLLTYPTSTVLRQAFESHEIDFIDCSRQLMDVLAGKANQASLAKGGYVLMAHGQSDSGMHWFLVAIINNVASSAVNEETLEIVDAVHVDLENLRVAGRVNLTSWFGGDEQARYVNFLKHRGEVADYFKFFLGCNVIVKDVEETRKLVGTLREFAKDRGLSLEQEEEFLKAAHDYCRRQSRDKQPLSLEELTNVAWPQEPHILQMALAQVNLGLSDGFVPDSRVLKSLLKYQGKNQYWTLDLHRAAFLNEAAEYLPGPKHLLLKKLPDHLVAELDQEVAGDDD